VTALRCGLIGLGMMGRNHARVLNSLEGVSLVAVVDPQGDRLGVRGGSALLTNIDDLIAMKPDYVVVAVPTQFHEPAALALAQARIPTLIEKPLTTDPASAERVVAAFEDADVIGGVGHIERYNPALQQARSRLANGDIGEIYQVVTRRQGPFPDRVADVGVIKDLCTHDIDLTAWITDSAYLTVAAQTAHRSGREHEDLVAVTGTLEGGIVANHLVNWLSPLKERITVITGERGTFVADTLTADLTFYSNGLVETHWDAIARFRGVSEGDVIRYAFPKKEPLRSEHEAFRDAIGGDPSGIVSLREGLGTVRVAEAVAESAREGHTVRLVT
jgi:UDP-N-acetylglucosamine 3-dehydrogenase